MNFLYRIVAFVLLISFGMAEVIADDGLDELRIIKDNYRSYYLNAGGAVSDSLLTGLLSIPPESEMSDQIVVELHQRYPFDKEKIKAWIDCFDSATGIWSDINYSDDKRSGWEPKQHVERLLELAKLYYSPSTDYYCSESLMDIIHRGLGYWLSVRPKCRNWWYNEIGVPKVLGAALILLEDELVPSELTGAIEVMAASKFGRTGQNKVWLAGNVLTSALLQNNLHLVKAARDTIASEICLGREEGIKSDWSFHQHGPQQQFGNYGLSFISGMSFFNRLFRGTSMEFDRRQKGILDSLVNEGYRWVIWHRFMDIGALGRQYFHNSQLHKGYALAFAAADLGIGGFAAKGNGLVGHKHFFDSDYTVHREPSWMMALKMSSSRVIGTEVVNEDNLKGYYTGDGATYYYMEGDDYLNVFPLWDWRKIPGVTAFEDDSPLPNVRQNKRHNVSPMVGGITDGKNGMSVMTLDRDGLKAHKAYVMTSRYVLCFGCGITSDSILNVTTSIDQRVKKAPFMCLENGRWMNIGTKISGSHGEARFFHRDIGYIVPEGQQMVVEAGKRKGRWHDFMKMYKPADVEGEIVSLYLDHGAKPENASYMYIVMPDASPDDVTSFDYRKEFKVIRNDKRLQAVRMICNESDNCWAAVYEAAPFVIDDMEFRPRCPGIYLLSPGNGRWIERKATYFE